MDRKAPGPASHELELYVTTYYSLLRSSGDVRVRAFEEAHAFSHSSLHERALEPLLDLSAFAYAAGRLPVEMPRVRHLVLGQSHELFEAEGLDVRSWKTVKTRGRRRPLRWDGGERLAVFIASASDIDDLVPIVTAYQIEWNKMHHALVGLGVTAERAAATKDAPDELAKLLGIDQDAALKLLDALGRSHAEESLRALVEHPLDLTIRMLAPSFSQYQRAAQRWWSGVEPTYLTLGSRAPESRRASRPPQASSGPRRAPVYFVSSNTHAIANLMGGYARTHADEIFDWAERTDPEGLAADVQRLRHGSEEERLGLCYYLLRGFIYADPSRRMGEVRDHEARQGLLHLNEPGHIDVDAQVVTLGELDPKELDPRLVVPGIERLAESDALVVNIDYPLGMAAYHLLSRVGQGVGEIRGIYVMGKAATLNARVGDVMVSRAVYDEHSQNTFLFRNAFSAKDVRPFLKHGSVFDNQKAVTVRSAFLQNKDYMSAFYASGYTVLEMEAGPFLGAIFELVNPRRVPQDEIVHLSAQVPFDVGILHYASDTPYSRRQSLLSKSLSYFGVDSTYASAIAIVRRILEREVARLEG